MIFNPNDLAFNDSIDGEIDWASFVQFDYYGAEGNYGDYIFGIIPIPGRILSCPDTSNYFTYMEEVVCSLYTSKSMIADRRKGQFYVAWGLGVGDLLVNVNTMTTSTIYNQFLEYREQLEELDDLFPNWSFVTVIWRYTEELFHRPLQINWRGFIHDLTSPLKEKEFTVRTPASDLAKFLGLHFLPCVSNEKTIKVDKEFGNHSAEILHRGRVNTDYSTARHVNVFVGLNNLMRTELENSQLILRPTLGINTPDYLPNFYIGYELQRTIGPGDVFWTINRNRDMENWNKRVDAFSNGFFVGDTDQFGMKPTDL
jgi:hypothetical protein